MYPSDDQLVTAYLERNDQHAFGVLVERHKERVYGYLVGMVRDREVANDLFQETFLRVISAMQRKRGSYLQQGRWLAWVMRIARNAALDYFRSRKKWIDVMESSENEDNSYWDRLPDTALGADEMLSKKEQAEWLDRCVARLPEKQREVLLLRQDADLTFREIAAITNVSINTALGRMRYALLNLRRMSIKEEEEKVDLTAA